MRTTVNLEAEVQAAVEHIRVCQGLSQSEAINQFARVGLERGTRRLHRFVQRSTRLGALIGLSDTGEALECFDGADYR